METRQIYISNIGEKEKHFFTKRECEDYEASMKDYLTLKFIVTKLTPNKSTKDYCLIFRVKENLQIIIDHTTYDSWGARPPLREIKDISVNKYLEVYYKHPNIIFEDYLSHLLDDLVKLRGITYKNTLLVELIKQIEKEISSTDDAIIFINKLKQKSV